MLNRIPASFEWNARMETFRKITYLLINKCWECVERLDIGIGMLCVWADARKLRWWSRDAAEQIQIVFFEENCLLNVENDDDYSLDLTLRQQQQQQQMH